MYNIYAYICLIFLNFTIEINFILSNIKIQKEKRRLKMIYIETKLRLESIRKNEEGYVDFKNHYTMLKFVFLNKHGNEMTYRVFLHENKYKELIQKNGFEFELGYHYVIAVSPSFWNIGKVGNNVLILEKISLVEFENKNSRFDFIQAQVRDVLHREKKNKRYFTYYLKNTKKLDVYFDDPGLKTNQSFDIAILPNYKGGLTFKYQNTN